MNFCFRYKSLQTLIALLVGVLVYSQNSIRLRVSDGALPISSAIYQLKQNNKIVKFGNTDEQGFAQIDIETNQPTDYTIKITKFGYDTYEEPVKSTEISVKLSPKPKEIKEIVIRNANIFKVREDTIVYNLKNIRDGNEKKLEDLVKKLPGLEIDANGKVKYQGSNVGNILVEGQEFFGKQHQMATKNIDAEAIEGLDFIKKYTTDSGATTSALNVKLKEGYRNRWTGNLELGGGFTNKYSIHSNLFNFQKTGNVAIITDFNNIGKLPISQLDYLEFKEGNNVMKAGTYSFSPPEFLMNNLYFSNKRNQFMGVQVNKKINSKLRFKFYSMLNFNQLEKHSSSKKTYFASLGNITSNDFDTSQDKSFFLHTKTILNYTFDKDHFLNYDLVINPMSDSGNRQLSRSFSSNSVQNISQNKTDKNFSFGQNLKYQNPLSKYVTWNFELNQNSINKTEKIQISSDSNLFNSSDNQLVQNLKFRENSYRLASELAVKLGFNKFYINTEFKNQNTTLNIENKTVRLLNNLHLIGFSWNRNWSDKFTSTLELNLVGIGNLINEKSYNFNRIEPSINLDYSTKIGNFRLYSKLGHKQYSIYDFHPEYISDFQNITTSSIPLNNYVKTFRLDFTYYKFSVGSGNFLLARYSFSKDFSPISNNITNFILWQKNENIIVDYTQNQNFNISYDLKFRDIALSLKNNFYGYFSKNIGQINNQENVSNSARIQGGQSLVSNFENPFFQFDLGYKIDFTKYNQSYNNNTNRQTDYTFHLNLKGNHKKKFFWNLGFEYITQNSSYQKNNFFSINPEITYKPTEKSLELSIKGNNILNLKGNNLIRTYQSVYYEQISTINSFPGYMIFSIKFSI